MSEAWALSGREFEKSLQTATLRLLYATVILYLTFILAGPIRLTDLEKGGSNLWFIACMDVAMLLVTATLIVWLRKSERTRKQTHTVGALLIFLAASNAEVTALLLSSSRELFYVAFMLVCVGAIVLSRRFVWIANLLTFLSVFGVAAYVGDTEDIVWAIVTVLAGGLFSAIIFEGRMGAFNSIESLRKQDQEKQVQLEKAVSRAEEELTERIQAENRSAEAEAQKLALTEQLQRAQKLEALGTLAGGVAHDMNNVLVAIRGIAEAACNDASEGSSLQEDLRHIVAATDQGSALTRNLLGFARKGKRHNRPFRGRDVANEVIGILNRTAPKRIAISLSKTDVEIESDVVVGDAAQIGHALMNLCLNSIDSSDGETSIEIFISSKKFETNEKPGIDAGKYVSIAVRDNGWGMNDETQSRIFEPFFSTKGEGNSGLGLSMVYGTVIDHKGHIEIESEIGEGSLISMFLPMSDSIQETAETRVSNSNSGAALPSRPILIIDDEAMVRHSMARTLKRMGIDSFEAGSGFAGLELLKEKPGEFGGIILDLSMPKMDGTECLHRLREFDTTTPVILASGYPKGQNVETLLETGADAFIGKPFSSSDLKAALQKSVERHQL